MALGTSGKSRVDEKWVQRLQWTISWEHSGADYYKKRLVESRYSWDFFFVAVSGDKKRGFERARSERKFFYTAWSIFPFACHSQDTFLPKLWLAGCIRKFCSSCDLVPDLFFLTEQTYDGIVPQCTGLMTLFLLLLGFVTQLFAEHMTVFVVVYAVWMVFLGWMRHKKIYGLYLSYLFGALAGAVVMFSNSAYRNAADGTDSYKHIGFSVGALLEQFAGLWDDLLLNNWLLNILLAGTVLYLIGKREKNKFAATLFGLILCGYGTYSVFHRVNPSWYFVGNESLNQWIEVVLGMLFVGTVVAGIWRCEEKSRRASICMLVLCSVFVAMPLLAANPIGARCFFASYIFQVVALLKLLQDILKEKKNLYLPFVCVLTIVLALCVMYLRMFSIVGGTDRIRAQRISSGLENHQKELILPILPYSDYYWTTIPVNKTWEKRFKEFYHIPQDVAVKFQ